MAEVAQYAALRDFLQDTLREQQSSNSSSQRTSAREKLTKLTKLQFSELATDVYDEMQRRQLNSVAVPFLQPREDLYDKRNQARKKLSSLPSSRFKELASDVYYEIERRYPHVTQDIAEKLSPNHAQALDSVENRSVAKGQADANSSLDNLMADLGSMLSPKSSQSGVPLETVDKLRADYESRIHTLEARIAQLEKEASKVEQLSKVEEKLQAQLKINRDLESTVAQLQSDHAKLKENYESLQDDYNNQQQIAQDIRTEASNLLAEIKSLSKRNEELTAERDRLLQQAGIAAENGQGHGDVTKGEPTDIFAAIDPSSVVDRSRISSYQLAVDELLQAARSSTPTSVLVAMKAIVIACKNITEDTEAFENSTNSISPADKDRLEEVKNKLSQSLTTLMNSAKNHAQNYGSLPISLLQDTSSELSVTIVELVNLLQRGNENGSTDSENFDIDDLKLFLEKQTDLIVQAIQTLLHAMRTQQGAFGQDFINTVNGITGIVDNLVSVSRRTLASPSATAVRARGEKILDDLSNANVTLGQLGTSMVNSPQSKTLKQRLASSSYEIAKYVKEVIGLLE